MSAREELFSYEARNTDAYRRKRDARKKRQGKRTAHKELFEQAKEGDVGKAHELLKENHRANLVSLDKSIAIASGTNQLATLSLDELRAQREQMLKFDDDLHWIDNSLVRSGRVAKNMCRSYPSQVLHSFRKKNQPVIPDQVQSRQPTNSKNCDLCQNRIASFVCVECKEIFCTACNQKQHATRKKKTHKRKKLEKSCPTCDGTGVRGMAGVKCSTCHGKGKLEDVSNGQKSEGKSQKCSIPIRSIALKQEKERKNIKMPSVISMANTMNLKLDDIEGFYLKKSEGAGNKAAQEKLVYHYSNGAQNPLQPKDPLKSCILLTNRRILRVREKKVESEVSIPRIAGIQREGRGALRSDYLIFTLKPQNRLVTYEIWHADAAKFFRDILSETIEDLEARRKSRDVNQLGVEAKTREIELERKSQGRLRGKENNNNNNILGNGISRSDISCHRSKLESDFDKAKAAEDGRIDVLGDILDDIVRKADLIGQELDEQGEIIKDVAEHVRGTDHRIQQGTGKLGKVLKKTKRSWF